MRGQASRSEAIRSRRGTWAALTLKHACRQTLPARRLLLASDYSPGSAGGGAAGHPRLAALGAQRALVGRKLAGAEGAQGAGVARGGIHCGGTVAAIPSDETSGAQLALAGSSLRSEAGRAALAAQRRVGQRGKPAGLAGGAGGGASAVHLSLHARGAAASGWGWGGQGGVVW